LKQDDPEGQCLYAGLIELKVTLPDPDVASHRPRESNGSRG